MTETPFLSPCVYKCYRFPDGFIGLWEGVGCSVRRQPTWKRQGPEVKPRCPPRSVSGWCHQSRLFHDDVTMHWLHKDLSNGRQLIAYWMKMLPLPPSLSLLFHLYPSLLLKHKWLRFTMEFPVLSLHKTLPIKSIFISSFGQPAGSSNTESLQ